MQKDSEQRIQSTRYRMQSETQAMTGNRVEQRAVGRQPEIVPCLTGVWHNGLRELELDAHVPHSMASLGTAATTKPSSKMMKTLNPKP